MKIAILGTGIVARTLAGGFTRVGHDVTLGTRSPDDTAARDEYGDWASANTNVQLATFADAVEGAELVVNATNGDGTMRAIESAGPARLAGKVLIDASNPLDFSNGFPPQLSVKDSDSLAEQIQRAAPDARVVKAFNTTTAAVMVEPGLVGDGDSTTFVSGNDPAARATVVALLNDLGWVDVIELGDLSNARGQEMYMALWVRLMGAVGGSIFNVKVVR